MIRGRLYRAGDNECLVDSVFKTTGFIERMCGLLCRPPLESGEALLISPCSSVHTFGMRYTIDLAFLDREWTIIKTVNSLPPWRMAACPAARMVIELKQGGLESMQLAKGIQLRWMVNT